VIGCEVPASRPDVLSPSNVKSRRGQSDSEDSDGEDLDDDEVSLGSLAEEDFGGELEEDEGGTFMDVEEGMRRRVGFQKTDLSCRSVH